MIYLPKEKEFDLEILINAMFKTVPFNYFKNSFIIHN